MRAEEVQGHLAVFTANILYGILNVATKLSLSGLNPLMFQLVREIIAGPLLLFIAYQGNPESRILREDRLKIILCGFCLYGVNSTYVVAVKLTGANTAAAWQPAEPVIMCVMAVALGFERSSILRWLGILIAVAGGLAYVLAGTSRTQSSDNHGEDEVAFLVGNLLLLAEGVFMAGVILLEKGLLLRYSPSFVLGNAYIVATVLMCITTVVVNQFRPLLDVFCPDCDGYGWNIPDSAWPGILYAALCASALGYYLVAWGNQYIDASVVAVYTVVQPIGTLLCCAAVVVVTAHSGLHASLQWKDFAVLGICAGLMVVSYDNWLRSKDMATASAMLSGSDETDKLLANKPPTYNSISDKPAAGKKQCCCTIS